MAEDSIHRRALHRAAQIAGGADALAKALDVPAGALRMWLGGRPVPPDIFLRAVDLIIESDVEAMKTEASQQRREA